MISTSEKKQKNILSGFYNLIGRFSSYIFIGLTLFLGLSLIKSVSDVRGVEKRISDKEREIEGIKNQQTELSKKLEMAKSQEFVESQLRNKLGLSKEGEIVVILPPEETLKKIAPKPPEETTLLPDPNWKKWMKLFF
jgi:cell division protein FtsB